MAKNLLFNSSFSFCSEKLISFTLWFGNFKMFYSLLFNKFYLFTHFLHNNMNFYLYYPMCTHVFIVSSQTHKIFHITWYVWCISICISNVVFPLFVLIDSPPQPHNSNLTLWWSCNQTPYYVLVHSIVLHKPISIYT